MKVICTIALLLILPMKSPIGIVSAYPVSTDFSQITVENSFDSKMNGFLTEFKTCYVQIITSDIDDIQISKFLYLFQGIKTPVLLLTETRGTVIIYPSAEDLTTSVRALSRHSLCFLQIYDVETFEISKLKKPWWEVLADFLYSQRTSLEIPNYILLYFRSLTSLKPLDSVVEVYLRENLPLDSPNSIKLGLTKTNDVAMICLHCNVLFIHSTHLALDEMKREWSRLYLDLKRGNIAVPGPTWAWDVNLLNVFDFFLNRRRCNVRNAITTVPHLCALASVQTKRNLTVWEEEDGAGRGIKFSGGMVFSSKKGPWERMSTFSFRVLNYALGFNDLTFLLILDKRSNKPKSIFTSPLDLRTWVLVFLINSAMVVILYRLTAKAEGTLGSFFMILGMYLVQGHRALSKYPSETRRIGLAVIILLWLLTVVVISGAYTGCLYQIMVNPPKDIPKTFAELAASSLFIGTYGAMVLSNKTHLSSFKVRLQDSIDLDPKGYPKYYDDLLRKTEWLYRHPLWLTVLQFKYFETDITKSLNGQISNLSQVKLSKRSAVVGPQSNLRLLRELCRLAKIDAYLEFGVSASEFSGDLVQYIQLFQNSIGHFIGLDMASLFESGIYGKYDAEYKLNLSRYEFKNMNEIIGFLSLPQIPLAYQDEIDPLPIYIFFDLLYFCGILLGLSTIVLMTEKLNVSWNGFDFIKWVFQSYDPSVTSPNEHESEIVNFMDPSPETSVIDPVAYIFEQLGDPNIKV